MNFSFQSDYREGTFKKEYAALDVQGVVHQMVADAVERTGATPGKEEDKVQATPEDVGEVAGGKEYFEVLKSLAERHGVPYTEPGNIDAGSLASGRTREAEDSTAADLTDEREDVTKRLLCMVSNCLRVIVCVFLCACITSGSSPFWWQCSGSITFVMGIFTAR